MDRVQKKGDTNYQYLMIFATTLLIGMLFFIYASKIGHDTAIRHKESALANADASGGRSLNVIEIYFEDGTDEGFDEKVDKGFVKARLSPTSDEMRFSDISISFRGSSNERQVYSFNRNLSCEDMENFTSDSFGKKHLLGDPSEAIRKGDIILLCFKIENELIHDDPIDISIIPTSGVIFDWESTLPQSLTRKRNYIYPENN